MHSQFESLSVERNQSRAIAAWAALAVFSIAALGQNAWYWTQLPNRVATQFDIRGNPGNWMDKTSATLLMLAAQLGLPWFLVGVAHTLRYLPASLINMPRREYWLHADRREESLAYMRSWTTWVALFTSLFVMLINHLTYVANINGMPLNLAAFVAVVAIYVLGILMLIGAMLRRFAKPQ